MSSNLKSPKASKAEKASLAIQAYAAYQQKKTVQGLEKMQAKMEELADLEKISIGVQESSRQLIEEQNRISRATQNEMIKSNQIQNEIYALNPKLYEQRFVYWRNENWTNV